MCELRSVYNLRTAVAVLVVCSGASTRTPGRPSRSKNMYCCYVPIIGRVCITMVQCATRTYGVFITELNHSIGRAHSWRFSFFYRKECLRKYVLKKLLLQKLSRRQYLRYIFLKRAKIYFIEGRFWSKVAVYFVSLFHWPTTHRAFVRGRTPLQRL